MSRQAWSRPLRRLADLVWPPHSLLSDAPVGAPGLIEPALWAQLQFLTGPGCTICGFPLPEDPGPEGVCGACAVRRPAFTAARAALAYDDLARRLVLDLKRAGRRDGLPVFANWMAEALGEIGTAAEVLVPVPLHWTRLASRGFNQAGWLAEALGRRLGRPVALAGLQRVKGGAGQAGLSASARRAKVAGAIQPNPGAQARLAGRRVLIVDDVYTTGATLEACARAVLRAGAARADAAALARVVRPVDVLI